MNRNDINYTIMGMLRERHKEDITEGELEAGRTGKRLDFLAIKCSWATPQIVGYEVKVDRQDFVRDKKWMAYLPFCRELVFVTASGVAKESEIPEECGWQELSKNGARLVTRKKAPVRVMKHEDEAVLYKRILMRQKGGLSGESSQEFWNRWLSKKREDRVLGRMVRHEIAVTTALQIENVKQENSRMKRRVENMEAAMKVFESLGLNPEQIARCSSWEIEKTVRRRLEAQGAGPVLQLMDNILVAIRNAEGVISSKVTSLKAEVEESLRNEQSQ